MSDDPIRAAAEEVGQLLRLVIPVSEEDVLLIAEKIRKHLGEKATMAEMFLDTLKSTKALHAELAEAVALLEGPSQYERETWGIHGANRRHGSKIQMFLSRHRCER